MTVKWRVENKGNYKGLEIVEMRFEFENGIATVEDLRQEPPVNVGNDILLLNGRAPIWFYCYLTHYYSHLVKVIATYDPKLSGFVVVSSHCKEIKIGEIIKVEE